MLLNSTPHPDARARAVPCEGSWARAGGRGRWEGPFRAKLENELPATDLMFLMGTMHRFPDQWLIVSL